MFVFTTPIDEANEIVAALLPGAYFEKGSFRSREIWYLRPVRHIACPSIPIMLSGDGSRLSLRKHESRYGDLVNTCLAQLFRFGTDQSRKSSAWWARVLPPEVWATVRPIMDATDYDDPAKTACVLCGAMATEDWWSGGGMRNGPCCRLARCVTSEAIRPMAMTTDEEADAI